MLFPLYDLNPHRRFPWITVLLIAINVFVMASQGWEPSVETVYNFGFIPKRATGIDSGKPLIVPLDNRGDFIRLSTTAADVYPTFITTMFIHGGWFHLLMNMWMLWIFGNNVEDRLGRFMYVVFYLLGGLIGTACQWAYHPLSTMPIVGASGAVATVLGGYAITYPHAKVKTLIFVIIPLIFDLPALVVLGVWFLAQMFAAAKGLWQVAPGEAVAFWAHIGGFLAGMIMMPLFSFGAQPADVDWKAEAQESFRFDDPRARIE
jgi:membrane associated rhomboid family serine protease